MRHLWFTGETCRIIIGLNMEKEVYIYTSPLENMAADYKKSNRGLIGDMRKRGKYVIRGKESD